jgi:hypothetical protein
VSVILAASLVAAVPVIASLVCFSASLVGERVVCPLGSTFSTKEEADKPTSVVLLPNPVLS